MEAKLRNPQIRFDTLRVFGVRRGFGGIPARFFSPQRKSSKAKEKKQKRLEERAAMDAVCAKVEAANKLEDPLEAFPVFKKYDRNGLNVAIECKRVSGLEPATLEWAFDLTKANMQTL
ncbi:PREDICTED: LOW QUALITY PROTEIN: N-alpha-acetyltransferase 40 [Aptenodytes forsteri]|uniref:LOW QUALITY PROTEIN: N-alpha-acetyltransferase 40 n=1 Tax=Aptenodytes forsteri TaxID=9233 RepID=UPI000904EC0C|nr:PREDICTED: LOW QUALITY PROTEIN: N-alpha-acetyltransferase 40 [Aptenodytes forsteri]